MEQVSNESGGTALTRRQAIGLGASGLGASVVGGGSLLAAHGHAAAPQITPSPAVLDPPVSGLSYLVLGPYDFVSTGQDVARFDNTGVYADGAVSLRAPIRLPAGTMVEELTVSVLATTAVAASLMRPSYLVTIIDAGLFNIGTDITWEVSPSIQTKTTTLERTVTHGRQHLLSISVPGGAGAKVVGAMIGYVGPPTFVPIVPARAYDSRLGMSPDANGRLAGGDNRTISVADGRNATSGAVELPDVVPEGARAVAYNLTVAAPSANGFLAIAPGGTADVEASSINWSSPAPLALANAGIVALDDDRKVTVFAGGNGSSTHFVLDVTGYYI